MRDLSKEHDPVGRLLEVESRGEVKEAGAWLDGPGRAHRAELVRRARAGGAELPEDWEALDGKRLLRAALARSAPAQVRRNPIARDEAFRCAHCGADVPPGGRRPRDHCPRCLHSLHVDVVPGDRAADCGGLLVPVALERAPKGDMIRYRCARCGATPRNRVLDDVDPPDDPVSLRGLVG